MAGTDFIRQFTKFFTNLTPSQEKEFERALLEVQDSKELTSLETSLSLLKRKVDQRLPIPQLTVSPTVRGGIVEWDPLPDQRISFYEIDVSTESNFSNFDTFTTFGVSTVIDGLTNSVFVRVRGVRRDGTTTPYSGSVIIAPTLFDITSHAAECFYVIITGTDPNTVLGGLGSTLDYTPINPNGNSMVWGQVSIYADPVIGLYGLDHITAQVVVRTKDSNDVIIGESTFWSETFGEFFNTLAIGPFTVPHPELDQKLEVRLDVRDKTTLADGSARSGNRTEVFWGHLNILEIGI